MFRHLLAGSAVPIKDREYGEALPALVTYDNGRPRTPVSAKALKNRRQSFVAATAARSPFMRLADLVDETSTEAIRSKSAAGDEDGSGEGGGPKSALPSLAQMKTKAAAAAKAVVVAHKFANASGATTSGSSLVEAATSTQLLDKTEALPIEKDMWWAEHSEEALDQVSNNLPNSDDLGRPISPAPQPGQLRRSANHKLPAGKVGLGLWSSNHWGSSRNMDDDDEDDGDFALDLSNRVGASGNDAKKGLAHAAAKRTPTRSPWDVSAPSKAYGGPPPLPESPQHVATRCRRWLIRKGVVPHQMGPASRMPASWSPALLKVTAFHEACYEGDLAIAKHLLKDATAQGFGAVSDSNALPIQHKSNHNGNALPALPPNPPPPPAALLKSGPLVNNSDNALGDTPLHLAAHRGWMHVVQWLVDGDASEGPTGCQIAQRNHHQRSPLALAARQGHAPVYRFLLARGACNYYLDELPTPATLGGLSQHGGSARGGGSRHGSAKSTRNPTTGTSRTSSASKKRTAHTPSAGTSAAGAAAAAAAAIAVLDPHEPLWWPDKLDTEERGLMTEAEEAALHLGWQRTAAGHVSKAALNRDVPPHLKLRMSLHHHPDTSPRNALQAWCKEQVYLNEGIWQGLLLLAMRPPEGRKLPPVTTTRAKKNGGAGARGGATSKSVAVEANSRSSSRDGGEVSPLPQRKQKRLPGRFRSAPVSAPLPSDPAAASAAPEWLRLLCIRAGPPPKKWPGPMNRTRGAGPRRRGAVGNAVIVAGNADNADNADDDDNEDGNNENDISLRKTIGKGGGLSKVFNADHFALPPKSTKNHGKHLKVLIAEFLGVPTGRELRNLREALVILEAPWEDPDVRCRPCRRPLIR